MIDFKLPNQKQTSVTLELEAPDCGGDVCVVANDIPLVWISASGVVRAAYNTKEDANKLRELGFRLDGTGRCVALSDRQSRRVR